MTLMGRYKYLVIYVLYETCDERKEEKKGRNAHDRFLIEAVELL